MEADQTSSIGDTSRSFSQAFSRFASKGMPAQNVTTLKMHPLQKDNPAVKGLGMKIEYDASMHIDVIVRLAKK